MTRPLWIDPDAQSCPALDGDLETDVAIVGGGLSGIGAASALAGRELRVALLEARTLGSGASGRNGGFVLRGPAVSHQEMMGRYGEADAEGVWQLTAECAHTIAELVEKLDIACGYLRRGSMSLAASEEEWQRLQERFASGSPGSACPVARSDLPRPFDRLYLGGIYHAGNAEMSTGAFVRSVAASLRRKVTMHECTRVEALLPEAGGWRLRTTGGVVRAAQVILATNAHTGQLLPGLPIVPTRGQVLATVPLDRVIVPFPMYANLGYEYWRQTAEGRLVIGGWRNLDIGGELGYDECLNPRVQHALDTFARDVAGAEVTIEYRWAGIMGFTPDHLPLIGSVPGRPGLYVAAGYSGHGVSMAFTCGQRVALQAIGEGAHIPACCDPGRFMK